MRQTITLSPSTYDEIMKAVAYVKRHSNNFTKSLDSTSVSSEAVEYQGIEFFVGFIRDITAHGESQWGGGQMGTYSVESCVNIGGAGGSITSWQRHEDDDPKRRVVYALNLAESNELFPIRKLLPGTRVMVFRSRTNYGGISWVFYATESSNGAPGYQLIDFTEDDLPAGENRWTQWGNSYNYVHYWKYKDRGELLEVEMDNLSPQTRWFRWSFLGKYVPPNGSSVGHFDVFNCYSDNIGRMQDIYKDPAQGAIGQYVQVISDVRWTGSGIEKKTKWVCALWAGNESGWT